MNISKQQKQIMLFLLKNKPRALRLTVTHILTQIDRATYGASDETQSGRRYVYRGANKARFVSVSRSIHRLEKEGYLIKDGQYWYLTDEGTTVAINLRREIRAQIAEVEAYKSLL